MRVFVKLLVVVLFLFVLFKTQYERARPKVYDCVLFFNEPELLEIRLSELYKSVDKFVIVETIENFQGKFKPLYFEENRHLFKKFEDKIVHIALKERVQTNDPWERKAFQRNQIMRGLRGCKDSDIVMLSNTDEIVKAKKIKELIAPLVRGDAPAMCAKQRTYTYFLNRFEGIERGSVVTTYAHLKSVTPHEIRRQKGSFLTVDDGGWHFRNVGGLQRVLSKIVASTNAHCMDEEKKDPNYLREQMEKGPFETIDLSFPKHVVQNKVRFREIGLIR